MTNSLKLVAKSILSVSLLSACQVASARGQASEEGASEFQQVGVASYYNDRYQGHRTASGERYDKTKLTVTHDSLPFGTKLRVTNLRNHRSVVVRVNDRARHGNHRLLDLSKQAAQELGLLRAGTGKVGLEVLNRPI